MSRKNKNHHSHRRSTKKAEDRHRGPAIEPLETRMLMTTVVVNTAVDAVYPPSSGLVSIRNAVATADSATTPTTITFDPTAFATPQTIVEDGTELTLSNTNEPISIIGSPAGVTLDANYGSRAIAISGGVTVEIAGFTIIHAHTKGYDFYGGAINNAGALTLVGSTLMGNVAADGGAITNSGYAALIDDTITGNTGYSPFGGGQDNSAVSNSGTMTIEDCTDVGNTSVGAAASLGNSGTCVVANSVFAANTEASSNGGDTTGTFTSYGYNLVGATDGSSGWNAADKTGTAASPLNPNLGALAGNGGPTETFLPNTGSPLIGAGSTRFSPAGYIVDQRGLSRTVGGAIDIGAVEVGGTAVSTSGNFVVNSTSDTGTGTGVVTLRDAVEMADADANAVVKTITFDPTVFTAAGTVMLGGTELTVDNIAEPITITAPSAGLTVNGNATSRVLAIGYGTQATISGVTVSNGNATDDSGNGGGIDIAGAAILNLNNDTLSDNTGVTNGSGGALSNSGTADLTDVTISGNTVTGSGASGGGIYNTGTLNWAGGSLTANVAGDGGGGVFDTGTITLADVTVSDNSSVADGGGIFQHRGTITATGSTFFGNQTSAGNGGAVSISNGNGTFSNVTITGNTCYLNGGAIELYSDSGATLTDDTLVGNSALNGGGIRDAGSATIGNTIIAQNTASSTGPDVSNGISSEGSNLIGATDGSSGWGSTDLTGTAAAPLNPDLGSLADNGGPTETLLPQSDSPALSAGTISLIPTGITTDQRGDSRTVGGAVDIGSVEVGGTAGMNVGSGVTTTATAINVSSSSVAVGQSVTLTAAVASVSGTPTGTVTFLDNGTSIGTATLDGTGVGSVTTTALPHGQEEITAVYSGDATYAASTSPQTSIEVSPFTSNAMSTTTLSASAQTVVVSNDVTFTVRVAPSDGAGPTPTGTVTFIEDGSNKGSFTLVNDGLTEVFTAETAGPNTVFTVDYSGDSNYAASVSNAVAQTYLPQSQLAATITRAVVPATGIAGHKYTARLPAGFKNTGNLLGGTFTATLYADTTSGSLSASPVQLQRVYKRTTLRTGRSLAITFATKTLPANLPAGVYHLLVEVLDPAGNYNLVNTDQTVTVSAPVVNLSATVSAAKPSTVAVGKSGVVVVTVTNTGNVNATGPLTIALSPSPDGVNAVADTTLANLTRKVTIAPGKTGRYAVRFKLPASLSAGSYELLAGISLDGVTTSAVGSAFTAG